MLGGWLKTLKFINGDIEFYKSDKLEYDNKYLRMNSDNKVEFHDYVGRVGLNNCFLDVRQWASVSGIVRVPSYMLIKGDVNLSTSPKMNLSVRSLEQGFINGEPMMNDHGRYAYGRQFTDYCREHFRPFFKNEDFETQETDSMILAYTIPFKSKRHIEIKDLCKKFNLIHIDSRLSPGIDIEYLLEDIADADRASLDNMLKRFVESEEFENAAKVRDEIRRRPSDFQ